MAVEKGDLVKFEYTARIKSSGQIVDTTDENKAKEAGIFDSKKRYGPIVINAGESELLKGVDEMLIGMNESESREFDVEPEKGFGARNEDLVRIIPLKQFKQAGINPVAGQIVNIDNTPAMVRAVNSGRVVADFNHPLAGVVLKYNVKVLKDAKSLKDKAGLFAERYGAKCSIKVDNENVEIDLGSQNYDEKRARDASAVALMARDLKKCGAKKVLFKGEWNL